MRKRVLLVMLGLVQFLCVLATVNDATGDSLRVVEILESVRKKNPVTNSDCVMFIARKFIGTPYVASTLEVNPVEKLVINLRQLDCTTYVENVLALTLCHVQKRYSYKAFRENLVYMRYRRGEGIEYTARLHYFTDWINDNVALGICKNIDSPNPPFTRLQHVYVDWMSKHVSNYPMLARDKAAQKEMSVIEKRISGKSYRYIPKQEINNSKLLRSVIKDGDVIVILTSKQGLDTQHLGFAAWHNDGLHLLNASSIHHKVVEEKKLLFTYLKEHKSMIGIRVVRM